MVDHHCELRDYHMITLEYCDKNVLNEREQFYINKFKSEYFGFNQLNSISLYMEYIHAKNDMEVAMRYFNAVKTNALLLKRYWGFGFTVFNYEYAFFKEKLPTSKIECDEVKAIANEANGAILELSKFVDSDYEKSVRKIELEKECTFDQLDSLASLVEQIDKKIEKQKKKLRTNFKAKLNYSPTRSEFGHFIEGIHDKDKRKQFNAEMKNKGVRYLVYVRLKEEINAYKMFVEEQKCVILEEENRVATLTKLKDMHESLKTDLRLSHLFPCVQYNEFPLKDFKRTEVVKENTIHFVISNNGRNGSPEIIVVYSNVDNKAKTYYVKNQTTTQTADYIERCAYQNSMNLFSKREVYQIIPRDALPWLYLGNVFCYEYISVLAEYTSGINEFSFIGEELIDIRNVIEDILAQLKLNPSIKITCTETNQILWNTLEKSLTKKLYQKIVKYKKI